MINVVFDELVHEEFFSHIFVVIATCHKACNNSD
jgi:hypothetical protein